MSLTARRGWNLTARMGEIVCQEEGWRMTARRWDVCTVYLCMSALKQDLTAESTYDSKKLEEIRRRGDLLAFADYMLVMSSS